MKIESFRRFDWQSAWQATVALFFLVGLACTAAWFAQNLRPLELVASILFVGFGWFASFRFVVALKAHAPKSQRFGARTAAIRSAEPAGISEPKMRERFVYFDPESGEDVYTMEPVRA